MTDDIHRPAQEQLDDEITRLIRRMISEWTLTSYEVVGVLTTIAARFAHESICHHEEDET